MHDPGLYTHRQGTSTEEEERPDPAAVVDQVTEAMRDAARASTPAAAERAATKVVRRWVLWVIAASAMVSVGMSWASLSIARDLRAQQAAAAIVAESSQRQVNDALAQFNSANAALAAQGKPPVPAPTAADPTDAFASLVTARVLARIPPPNGVTTQQLHAAIDHALRAQPGIPGPQGTGVSAVRPARRGAGCVLVTSLRDPVTGRAFDQTSAPIAEAFCNPAAAARTTTTTTATATRTAAPPATTSRTQPTASARSEPTPSPTPTRTPTNPELPELPGG